jgi:hypothetical protein
MTITIVGAGAVGTNLATALLRAGFEVRFAARDVSSEKVRAASTALGVDVVPLESGSEGTEVVVIAVPFAAVASTARALGDLSGCIVVDATNTVGSPLPDGARNIPDVIVAANPTATVVKAFNTIGAEAYLDPSIDGRPLFLPVAGAREPAETIRDLAIRMGFDAVFLGDGEAATMVERFAELWIHLAFHTGMGRDFGFALLHR